MAKVKALSRNKTIKIYHQISGLSYKECRSKLKASNWDILKAYGVGLTTGLEGIAEAIGEIVNNFAEGVKKVIDLAVDIINDTVDRVKMENAKDITEDPPVYYLGGVDMSDTKDITIY